MRVFLLLGDSDLTDAKPYRCKQAAVDAYAKTARDLRRFGQRIDGTIHSDHKGQPVDYPEYVLTLTPRGAVRIERA